VRTWLSRRPSYYLLPTSYWLLFTLYYVLLTTYYLLFTPGEEVAVKTYMLLLTTYYLLLTPYHILLTTYYLLFTFCSRCGSGCKVFSSTSCFSLLTLYSLLLPTYYLLFTPGTEMTVKTYFIVLTTYYLLLTFYWLCVSVCSIAFCGTHQVLVGRWLPLYLVDWLIVSLGRSPPNMLMVLLGSSHTIHMSRGYMCMVWVVILVVEDAALNWCRRKSGDTSQPVNL